jgi:predicted SprT family Zn-dependent metalloprotease
MQESTSKRVEAEQAFAEELEAARRIFPNCIRLRAAFFAWNRRLTSTLGRAHFHSCKIELSSPAFAVAECDSEEMRDTIRHELAHLVAFELYADRKHGNGFKRAAIALGARPKATAPASKFRYMPKTERRNWRRLFCSDCGSVFFVSSQRLGRSEAAGIGFSCSCGLLLHVDEERLTRTEAAKQSAREQAKKNAERAERIEEQRERERKQKAEQREPSAEELEAERIKIEIERIKIEIEREEAFVRGAVRDVREAREHYEAELAAWVESGSEVAERRAQAAENMLRRAERGEVIARERLQDVKGEEQC